MKPLEIKGNWVDIHSKTIQVARIRVAGGKIQQIVPEKLTTGVNPALPYLLPGFIDAHVHIESSLLIPSEFARLAVVHGTVATVSDPHEIANVCGLAGVDFMIANGNRVPFKFNFGAPSCVPATSFETAGAFLNADAVTALLNRKEIRYLSEMMNYPGVLQQDQEVMNKLKAAHRLGKPVDGHAPGLRGEQAQQYIEAGISTDHECFTYEEALEKIQRGMKVIIREGSAARNFEALIPLLKDFPDQIMFCSDDKHPDSLLVGHINVLCRRAAQKKIPLFHILQAACANPVIHYGLDVGLLREGDDADFIAVKDLESFEVLSTWIKGIQVAENGVSQITRVEERPLNHFHCRLQQPQDFELTAKQKHIRDGIPVIVALEGQLITLREQVPATTQEGKLCSNTETDVLKLVVVNRYREAAPAVAFIKNFGFKNGAIASSVAHDSHNIVAVGVEDESICAAINLVIEQQGGLSCVGPNRQKVVGLPVAGLMSAEDGYQVAAAYTEIDQLAKSLGTQLAAPFMTLSFMALLVIPHLKLSDKGLFDGDGFCLMEI